MEIGGIDPTKLTFRRFQEIAVNQPVSSGQSGNGQSKLKPQGPKAKVKKESGGEEKISDYRGLVQRYRESEFVHESVECLERKDRGQCRTMLRGFFGMYWSLVQWVFDIH